MTLKQFQDNLMLINKKLSKYILPAVFDFEWL